MKDFGLDKARECYFAAGGQESDIGPRDDPEWYWRRAAVLWRDEVNRLRGMIADFVLASQSNARAWKNQEHIAALFDEAKDK